MFFLNGRVWTKTLSWRILAMLVTAAFFNAMGMELKFAMIYAFLLNAIKAVLFYIHERFWEDIWRT